MQSPSDIDLWSPDTLTPSSNPLSIPTGAAMMLRSAMRWPLEMHLAAESTPLHMQIALADSNLALVHHWSAKYDSLQSRELATDVLPESIRQLSI